MACRPSSRRSRDAFEHEQGRAHCAGPGGGSPPALAGNPWQVQVISSRRAATPRCCAVTSPRKHHPLSPGERAAAGVRAAMLAAYAQAEARHPGLAQSTPNWWPLRTPGGCLIWHTERDGSKTWRQELSDQPREAQTRDLGQVSRRRLHPYQHTPTPSLQHSLTGPSAAALTGLMAGRSSAYRRSAASAAAPQLRQGKACASAAAA